MYESRNNEAMLSWLNPKIATTMGLQQPSSFKMEKVQRLVRENVGLKWVQKGAKLITIVK